MCGGNTLCPMPTSLSVGLSPRVRGKQIARGPKAKPLRSIPACAGETTVQRSGDVSVAVYPRVCGGNVCNPYPFKVTVGLSPRVRGKLMEVVDGLHGGGSIPACAGETSTNPILM